MEHLPVRRHPGIGLPSKIALVAVALLALSVLSSGCAPPDNVVVSKGDEGAIAMEATNLSDRGYSPEESERYQSYDLEALHRLTGTPSGSTGGSYAHLWTVVGTVEEYDQASGIVCVGIDRSATDASFLKEKVFVYIDAGRVLHEPMPGDAVRFTFLPSPEEGVLEAVDFEVVAAASTFREAKAVS